MSGTVAETRRCVGVLLFELDFACFACVAAVVVLCCDELEEFELFEVVADSPVA